MERFNGLLRSRDKALGVFHKAHRKLHEAIVQIGQQHAVCLARVKEHEQNAAAEKQAAEFLAAEVAPAQTTATKLGDILGVP